MRLVHYINEYKSKEYSLSRIEAAKMIEKNCSKYLKETKGNWFVRQINDNDVIFQKNELGYRQIRKNRRPQGMNKTLFDWFNKWLQKNGHVRRDQSVPMTSDRKHILIVNPMICFIEGNYDYTWAATSDINDNYLHKTKWYNNIVSDMYNIDNNTPEAVVGPQNMYNQLYNLYSKSMSHKNLEKYINSVATEWVSKYFPTFFFTNKGMQKAYKNKYEIWFKAKGYYYIKPFSNTFNHLKRKYK